MGDDPCWIDIYYITFLGLWGLRILCKNFLINVIRKPSFSSISLMFNKLVSDDFRFLIAILAEIL